MAGALLLPPRPPTQARQADAPRSPAPAACEIGGARPPHIFRTALAPGDYLRVAVTQRGVDAVVAIFGPDGRPRTTVDNVSGAYQREFAAAIADQDGEYAIEVRPARPDLPRGACVVNVVARRPATSADRRHIEADAAFQRGSALRVQGSADGRRRALPEFEQALAGYRDVGDRVRTGETLNRLGLTLADLDRFDDALGRYGEALGVFEALDDAQWRGVILNNIGLAHHLRGDLSEARDFYERSLPFRDAAADRTGKGFGLHNLGTALMQLGDYRTSVDHLQQALAIRRAEGDRLNEGNSLNMFGGVLGRLGDVAGAIDAYTRAIELFRGANAQQGEARSLALLGQLQVDLGDYQRGLASLRQSLAINRTLQNRRVIADALVGLGDIEAARGAHVQAAAHYAEALDLRRAAEERRGTAYVLNLLARERVLLGDGAIARTHAEEALAISREVGDPVAEAVSLENLGRLALTAGTLSAATALFDEALAKHQAAGDRSGEASVRYRLAEAQLARGDLAEAWRQAERALGLVEAWRSRVDGDELRAFYLATVQDYFGLAADLLMRMHEADPAGGHDRRAFDVAERSRARTLLESLGSARLQITREVDPALLAREREIEAALNANEFRRVRLLRGAAAPVELRRLEAESDRLLAAHGDLMRAIQRASPHDADLTQARPLTVEDVQQELGPETALLAFLLRDDRSVLWTITADGFASRRLPPRVEIETDVRRLLDALGARSETVAGEAAGARQARLQAADRRFGAAAARLGERLLAPALGAATSPGPRHLIVVADGALRQVPFAALALPAGTAGSRPLVTQYTVSSLPSASVMAELRRGSARPPATHALAVVADPVLDATDARVTSRPPSGRSVPPGDAVSRQSAAIDLASLRRLRFSRLEADGIAGLAPAAALKALDFDASRSTVLTPALGDYRIVHFATHALVDDRQPALSGLVLSMVDRQGRPVDGLVRLHDVYNLRLAAELVVLSACQTALGRELRGEGTIGLTRGFLYAGARRVVSSLWSVEDRATAELMIRFYRGLLQRGLAPPEALRQAQVAMAGDPRWQSPFYWAGFQLTGDWRP
jgi:CHAT domain-containing protein/predicted negative regulator of RcsB-dependent stress response